ncbi:MAG: sulfatase-like hydrolase/transferase [Pseudomonadales bacterium]|nr:sulfatase-like hydrolase/transferase [Pseudomonadales bacterium]
MLPAVLNQLRTLLHFSLLSSVLTLSIILAYISLADTGAVFTASFYVLSILGYYVFLAVFITLGLYPLAFIPVLHLAVILPKVILDFILLCNFFVFRLYKFHIDMMFINMAIHDAKGIGLSPQLIFIALIAFILVLGFNLFIYARAKRSVSKHTLKSFFTICLIVLSGQCIHSWAAYFNQHEITQLNPYFPYYLSSTATMKIDRLKHDYPFIIPENFEISAAPNKDEKKHKNALLHYPKNVIDVELNATNKPNILLFVLESWRADMLTAEVMPNLQQFADQNLYYSQHFSGGNVTVTGLFSLMYGLHPSYMNTMQSNPFQNQTLLTKTLADMGYSIEAFTSSNLNRFSLKDMFFGQIPDQRFNMHINTSSVEDDLQVVADVKQSLSRSAVGQPWFKFVFLTSSHHNYDYPEKFKRFTPLPSNAEGFLFDQNSDADLYINDYKNALGFMDSLFAEINTALKERGDDNTIVIVTSDHGEEFNDNHAGHWGHGRNFTRAQTHVPLIIKMPGQTKPQIINQRSAHVDIVPTLLLKAGVKNPVSDFSSGYDLFHLPKQRNIVAASYKDKAYIVGETIYSTGLFTDSYALDNFNLKNTDFDFSAIQSAKQEERDFYLE